MTTDPDHKFDLALGLDDLDSALSITRETPSDSKWRTIGDRALQAWKVTLAEECFKEAGDLSALLLIYTSSGSAEGMQWLAEQATAKGSNNIAFASRLLLQQKSECIDVLLNTDRAPEATFFARTYAPSEVPKSLGSWKSNLGDKGKKIADTLADPQEHPDAFEEGWEGALERERVGATQTPAPLTNGAAEEPVTDIVARESDLYLSRIKL